MRIEIDIPKEFEEHFKQDKFADTLHRLSADAHLIAGNYEQETAIMLIKAFAESKPAYDVEKVVGELEQKKEEVQKMRNTCVALSDLEVCDIENVTYERAIEIVKQGGVSDDVCEWKKEPSRLVGYFRNETSCGDSIDLQVNSELLKAFRYCPFCGKKIKVVELWLWK